MPGCDRGQASQQLLATTYARHAKAGDISLTRHGASRGIRRSVGLLFVQHLPVNLETLSVWMQGRRMPGGETKAASKGRQCNR